MRVLTIYAHHNPRSFCHAVLERFTAGLRDAGHISEVVDLHAIGFDPVFHDRDGPDWIDDSVPDDVLEHMHVKRSLLEGARNPLRRLLVTRWIGKGDDREFVRKLHALGPPRDVAEQQAKVAQADALAFVAPVYFVGFPAILKGWIERVFSLGFAFGMTAQAWRGNRPRLPAGSRVLNMPCRLASPPVPAIAVLISALVLFPAVYAADIYRWVDEEGRTHISDVVPPQHKKSARKIDPREFELSAEQVKEAQARAERDKARAALARQQRASAVAAGAPASGPAAAGSAPRPTVPAATDCATLRRLYRESQECFAPYRTATGTTKAEAFEKCTPVVDPELKCGPEKSN